MVAPSWESFQSPKNYAPKNQMLDQYQMQDDQINDFPPQNDMPEQQTTEQKPSWDQFNTPQTYQGPVDPTAEEDTLGYLARNMLSVNARGAEQVLGKAGNLEKFGKDVLSNFPSAGGLLGYGISKLVGPERWENMVKGPPGQQQLLPTSQDIRNITKEATEGFLEPKTKNEKRLHELAEDVAGTLSGRPSIIAGRNPLQSALINNLGIPGASNAVKQVVEGLGFGEEKGTLAKLGTWIFLSLFGNINAPKYASDLMNQGRKGMPDSVQMNVPRLESRLNAAERQLLHADPRSNLARQQIEGVRKDLANGKTSVRSGMDSYDGINAAKRSRGLFDLGNRSDQRAARRSIDLVRNAVRDEIMDSGQAHAQALENWRNGVQSWAVIHQSKALTNWVEDVAKGPYAKVLAGPATALFGMGSWVGSKAPLVSSTIGATAPLAYKAGQTAYRMFQDPRLANYYWNSLAAATRKDLPAFLNNYNKLNAGLKKKSTVPASKKKNAKAN